MKYRYTGILLILGFLISVTSCGDDFLNQPPRSALTAGSFPVSENDAVLATNAIYNALRIWQVNTGGFPILDMMSDECTKGSNPGDGTAIAVYDKFAHTPTEESVDRWYKTLYLAIRRANLVIEFVPQIDMDAALKDRLIAEARFLRAYFYGQLVRGFGAVPKVVDVDPPLDLTRAPASEIYNEIIYPDLEYAISILPEKSEYPPEDLGRATKGAALGLMARLKLFQRDFTEVETITRQIIESGEYDLVGSIDDIFTGVNEHNVESVFEISSTPGSFEMGGNQYANTQGVRGTPNKGWGFSRPAYPLITKFQDNEDPRGEAWILYLGEVIDGITIVGEGATPDTTYQNGQIVEIECYNQKVWYPGTAAQSSWGHNRRILRYADVLLMHAEALNENGKTSDALMYLNMIRERARGGNAGILPDITSTNQAEVRQAIADERNYELAFEGLRFWDLIRTNKAEEVLGPFGFMSNKNELLPIPQSEIDISQGRITQNQGY